MKTLFSLRLTLDNVLINADYEQRVIENLRYAKNIAGESFNVTFWNKDIPSPQAKSFIERNDYILCDIRVLLF